MGDEDPHLVIERIYVADLGAENDQDGLELLGELDVNGEEVWAANVGLDYANVLADEGLNVDIFVPIEADQPVTITSALLEMDGVIPTSLMGELVVGPEESGTFELELLGYRPDGLDGTVVRIVLRVVR